MTAFKSFGYVVGSNAYVKEVVKRIKEKRNRGTKPMSEQVKTPGFYYWKGYIGLNDQSDQHHAERLWLRKSPEDQQFWKEAAIAAHASFERQRREQSENKIFCSCGSQTFINGFCCKCGNCYKIGDQPTE